MEGMNKFKVLMVVVVFMFLFVVAAIYTNTKEATRDKAAKNIETAQQNENNQSENNYNNSSENTLPENFSSVIEEVNYRIDSLSGRIDGLESNTKYTCKVYGVVSDSGIEQLSPEAAIQEARENNKDFVMSCSF